jgi:hypothetical protein
LLHACAALPPLERRAPRSAHLTGQGISVFRRDGGDVYVALDWGQSGGGHGHPDRLNVLFMQGATRWLDDLGTDSYVDPSLHWYRSTLAHNAPVFDGRSQDRVDGELLAHDERGGVGWTYAAVNDVVPGVRVTRAVIVTPDYFVDELRWSADHAAALFLPIHFDGRAHGQSPIFNVALVGANGPEDGFNFLPFGGRVPLRDGEPVEIVAHRDGRTARLFLCTDGADSLSRFDAPGQPASETRPMYVLHAGGRRGAVRSVYAWSSRVDGVRFEGEKIEVSLGGERHVHFQTDAHWQMELTVGGAQSGIELTGWSAGNEPERGDWAARMRPRQRERRTARKPIQLPRSGMAAFDLGEGNYRRSEETWEAAGRPSARVTVGADADELAVDVSVITGDLVVGAANAVNPYDNEHPDINGHGVQLYVRTMFDGGAWMIVPAGDPSPARVRPIEGWGALSLRGAAWTKTAEGFRIRARVALPPLPPEYPKGAYPVSIDVLVNETVQGRERRRGQLVLSGAQGEFVYLRGDRHEAQRLVPIMIVD